MAIPRKPTATSPFGVGRRESHDSSDFYSRFKPPLVADDKEVNAAPEYNRIYCQDARHMPQIPDKSVALVVTSPPYFAGKEYERIIGDGQVPESYVDYLQMLRDVFAECARKLEPGGRLAVNVANLGRKPYRSLSADIIGILQDDLGMLLRGEIIWQKGSGASGSCAWGSFQNSSNPVLRDLSERIIVASKGRFDRALTRRERAKRNLPSEVTIFKDDFMEATTDIWEIPPESATRVGHPAPFPVELPQRLIGLYTYKNDVVLDPFMGAGTTAIAAMRSERKYVGYETEPNYVEAAQRRIKDEAKRQLANRQGRLNIPRVSIPAFPQADWSDDGSFQAKAVREGQKAKEIARAVLLDCGFTEIAEGHRFKSGVEVNFIAEDVKGGLWYFDVSGAFSSTRAGLRRTDTIWKALGKAALLNIDRPVKLILLTTDLPPKASSGFTALKNARGHLYFDAVEMLSEEGQARLRSYSRGGVTAPIGDLLGPETQGQ